MYGSIPGASVDADGIYTFPCDAHVNVTLVFGYVFALSVFRVRLFTSRC